MLGDASATLEMGMDVINGSEGESMSIVYTMEDTYVSWPSLLLTMMAVDARWIACIRSSLIPFGDNF